MQQRSLGREQYLLGELAYEIAPGQLGRGDRRPVIMALFRCRIGGPIAVAGTVVVVGVPVHVRIACDRRYFHLLAAVRGERTGMKTGKDHREEAEEGDERAHEGFVSGESAR